MSKHQKSRPGKNRLPPDPELFSLRFLVRLEEERPGFDDWFCRETRFSPGEWRGIHTFARSVPTYRNEGITEFSYRYSSKYGVSIVSLFMERWLQLHKIHEARYGKTGRSFDL